MSAKRKTKAQGLMMGVKALEDSIRIAREQARLLTQDYQARKNECLKELAKRIRQGETTGDEIADFLAVHPDYISSDAFFSGRAYEYLKELKDVIAESSIQPILIVKDSVNIGGFKQYLIGGGNDRSGLMPPPRYESWQYEVNFGISERRFITYDLKVPAMFVFSRNWLGIKTGDSAIEPVAAAGPFQNGGQELALPPLKDLLMNILFPEQNPRMYVVVGRKKVDEWLDCCHDKRLSRLIREKFAEWQTVGY